MIPNSLHARDIASLVHQQSDLDAFNREGGMIVARGEGCRVWDVEGREYIEAMAGLWCASLGFSEKRLADAAYKQLLTLPYYHTFFQKGHEPAIELAERLLALAPKSKDGKRLARAAFQCSGSEANDAAIKMIWYYNNLRGRPNKKKLIGRIRGYHGNTVAAASLSGQPHMHADFDLPFGDRFLHVDNPHYYRFHRDGENEEQFSARMAANLEALIEKEGAENIAAFFAEPVQGGGGAFVKDQAAGELEMVGQPLLAGLQRGAAGVEQGAELFAVAEAYPDLKASDNFRELQASLEKVEEALQMARRYYNGAVRNLNIQVESFPSNLVANAFKFEQAEYFELENEAERAVPQVKF